MAALVLRKFVQSCKEKSFEFSIVGRSLGMAFFVRLLSPVNAVLIQFVVVVA